MEQCEIMSAREEENKKVHEQHLEECRLSDQAHLVEMENKRITDAQRIDTKCADFWARKRRDTQKLRDKTQ